ncbi:MAG: hypothetical protein KA319_10540 [Ferruginibacter sp.]|nr:hypothetical protein [Ferruginibacter sp.]
MKKSITLLASLILCSPFLFAQQKTKPNAIYFQALGNGLLASINYERLLFNKPTIVAHAGVGIHGNDPKATASIPLGLKYLIKLKKGNEFLQIGMGATYSKNYVLLYTTLPKYENGIIPENKHWNYFPNIGFRSVSKKGFLFGIDAMLLFNNIHSGLPYIGLSFGKQF